jgi:trehalose 6-phosphate phosphatase
MSASAMTSKVGLNHPPLLRPLQDALFLDLDGTLLEIAEHPDAVHASAELLTLLRELCMRMDGACAVITGRTVADADSILKGALSAIAGVHGAEVKTPVASTVQWSGEDAPVWAARADAYALAARLQIIVEDKRASLALHYRHAPDRADEVREGAARIAADHGLRMMEGLMVIEILAGERTKGHALDAFMQQAPFKGRRPVAVGDDITDEDAFRGAAAREGYGVLVRANRATAATFALEGPDAVIAWLRASLSGPA